MRSTWRYGRVLTWFNDKWCQILLIVNWLWTTASIRKNIKECESEYRKNLKGVPKRSSR